MADYLVVHNGPQGSGDGSSVSNGMSLQGALDAVTAGNRILICNTGTYTLTAQLDVDTQTGTAANPIWVIGANASGVVDGTRPLIARGDYYGFVNGVTSSYYIFRYISSTSNTGNARAMYSFPIAGNLGHKVIDCDDTSLSTNGGFGNGASVSFIRCKITKTGTPGIGVGFWSGGIHIDCVAIGMAFGFYLSENRRPGAFINCIAFNCTTGFLGISADQTAVNMSKCIAYGCTTGLDLPTGYTYQAFINITNCTFSDCVTGISIQNTVATSVVIENCIIAFNSGYGINNVINTASLDPYIVRTLFYSNGSGNLALGSLDSSCVIDENPNFIDRTNATLANRNYSTTVDGAGTQRLFTDLEGKLSYIDWGAYQAKELAPSEIAEAVWTKIGRKLTT